MLQSFIINNIVKQNQLITSYQAILNALNDFFVLYFRIHSCSPIHIQILIRYCKLQVILIVRPSNKLFYFKLINQIRLCTSVLAKTLPTANSNKLARRDRNRHQLRPENSHLSIISKILNSFFFRILSRFKQNKSENLGGDSDSEISSGDLPPPPFLLLSFVTEARGY